MVNKLPKSIGKIVAIAIGSMLIVAMIIVEFMSSKPNGIGPYQAILMLLGLGILLLGLFPAHHWSSKLTLMYTSFVISLILIEGGFWLLARVNVPVTFPNVNELVDDPVLGKRTPPGAAGHDARGWRNETALDRADIVVIGDSQTWGVNAQLSETYPSVLADLSGKQVYSMAQGSYGAVQYRVLTADAIELQPELVIVGSYFGNDFADAYAMVYGDYAHQELRNPSFDMSAVTETIAEKVIRLRPEALTGLNRQTAAVDQSTLTLEQRVRSGTYIGRFLTSAGIFEPVDAGATQRQVDTHLETVQQHPGSLAFYEDDGWRTYLTPAYRQVVQDVTDPTIQEGIRITKIEFMQIRELLATADIELLIVIIPTKELIYAPYVETMNEPYSLLVDNEMQIRDELMRFLNNNDIAFVDTLPALRNAVENSIPLYASTFDGHPNANGYRIIAEVIWEHIESTAMQ